MDALVMCGGRGTRLDADREKPLVRAGGVPMVERVIEALSGASGVGAVRAVVSPHAPDTREFLDGRVPLVETPGEGYVADLSAALADPRVERPVLTAVADLPLLAPAPVDDTVNAHARAGEASDLAVCVPAALKAALGVSAETTHTRPDGARPTGGNRSDPRAGHGEREVAPAGLNVVGAGEDEETLRVSWDARLAVNVNYREDLAVAERLLGGAGTDADTGADVDADAEGVGPDGS